MFVLGIIIYIFLMFLFVSGAEMGKCHFFTIVSFMTKVKI